MRIGSSVRVEIWVPTFLAQGGPSYQAGAQCAVEPNTKSARFKHVFAVQHLVRSSSPLA